MMFLRKRNAQQGRAGIALLVLLLVVAGAAGWYFLVYLRSPQVAARQFLEALKTQNYEQIYQTCVWTGLLANVQSGQDVQRALDTARRFGIDVTIQGYEIKGVETQENSATVKTSVMRGGKSEQWNLIMVKTHEGKWKCDIAGSLWSAISRSFRMPSLPGGGSGR
ncbi:MAG: hypothetical protein RMM06_03705 [Armatimonadota bacterium]|nr:hypothetical protein [Armatimonadota bacterium]